jgi:hypothetical protein
MLRNEISPELAPKTFFRFGGNQLRFSDVAWLQQGFLLVSARETSHGPHGVHQIYNDRLGGDEKMSVKAFFYWMIIVHSSWRGLLMRRDQSSIFSLLKQCLILQASMARGAMAAAHMKPSSALSKQCSSTMRTLSLQSKQGSFIMPFTCEITPAFWSLTTRTEEASHFG